jgi:hypothetical protein
MLKPASELFAKMSPESGLDIGIYLLTGRPSGAIKRRAAGSILVIPA